MVNVSKINQSQLTSLKQRKLSNSTTNSYIISDCNKQDNLVIVRATEQASSLFCSLHTEQVLPPKNIISITSVLSPLTMFTLN